MSTLGALTPLYRWPVSYNGTPASGAKLNTYLSGTTTPASVYTDVALTTPHANPVVADSLGVFPVIYLAQVSYRFEVTTSTGVVIYPAQDNISAAGATLPSTVTVQGVAGETLVAGNVVWLSDGSGSTTAGRWYKTDSTNTYSSTLPAIIGIAGAAIATAATGSIYVNGQVTGLTGLTAGTSYYVSATPGGLTSSAPANSRLVGVADSTTSLVLRANILNIPIPVTQGGTGLTTLTANSLMAGNGTSTPAFIAPSTSGNLLASNGTAWASTTPLIPAIPVTVPQGGTGLTTLTANNVILGNGTATPSFVAPSTSGNLLSSNGTTWVSTAPTAAVPQALGVAEGRLTLTSGTPVTTADVSAAVTAYYTPYIGNAIVLYDGTSAWAKYTFTELTISLVGLTASKPYDVFAYNNAGTVAIETLVWTSGTARATALVYQNGVLVKSGATTRRYLGTIYINSTGGQTDDTFTKRFVWNYYNRVARAVRRFETTASWTYTTATWRQANGAAANKIELVSGLAENGIELRCMAFSSGSTTDVQRGTAIGENSTSAPFASSLFRYTRPFASAGAQNLGESHLATIPATGYNYYAWLETSEASGVTTWFGVSASNNQQGIIGTWVS